MCVFLFVNYNWEILKNCLNYSEFGNSGNSKNAKSKRKLSYFRVYSDSMGINKGKRPSLHSDKHGGVKVKERDRGDTKAHGLSLKNT